MNCQINIPIQKLLIIYVGIRISETIRDKMGKIYTGKKERLQAFSVSGVIFIFLQIIIEVYIKLYNINIQREILKLKFIFFYGE